MINELILQNLSYKLAFCLASSYILSTISIKFFLNIVAKKANFYQPIRSDGPQTDIKAKKNTPTFGGVFIVLSTIFSTILFTDFKNSHYILPILLVFASFALIGFVDDFLKVFYKNSKGFRGSIKLVIQFFIISSVYIWLGFINEIHNHTQIFLPINEGILIGVGLFIYIVFVNFVIVGTSNAVNLTDGLDGLVSVPAIINLICLSFLIYIASNLDLSTKFNVLHIKNSQELLVFCFALIGAIIGFLQFNYKPAKIFMGDVGSLAIGSALGLMAIIIKQEFVFFIISLLFVIEACSVILQVGSYKLRKKRIFLMAPIHHHFEKKGWSEKKVVFAFWSFALICAVLGGFVIVS